MKRILLNSTLVLTLAATAAFAQQATQPSGDATTAQQPAAQQGHHRGHSKMDPHKAAQHVGKRLGLSDDQTAKLEPIFADSQQKIASLRANTSLTPDQRREQMLSIHKDTQTQLSSVLTPDQMQQLRSMRHGHGKHQGGGQQPESSAPPSAS